MVVMLFLAECLRLDDRMDEITKPMARPVRLVQDLVDCFSVVDADARARRKSHQSLCEILGDRSFLLPEYRPEFVDVTEIASACDGPGGIHRWALPEAHPAVGDPNLDLFAFLKTSVVVPEGTHDVE